jgi:hypothetical protein
VPLVDLAHALEIARAVSPANANETVLAAQLRTFGEVGSAFAPMNGPRPAAGSLVWMVNLGHQTAQLIGQGTIVVIDAADGHVIQSYDWTT